MFKVISSAESKEIGEWEIVRTDTNEVVASIVSDWYWGSGNKKQLKVKDKIVCNIKNQAEAIKKLEEFFFELDRDIQELKNNQTLLIHNLTVIEGYYTHNLIMSELKNVAEKIKELEEYSLK